MKCKKLVSLISALSISVSAFAGLTIQANAAADTSSLSYTYNSTTGIAQWGISTTGSPTEATTYTTTSDDSQADLTLGLVSGDDLGVTTANAVYWSDVGATGVGNGSSFTWRGNRYLMITPEVDGTFTFTAAVQNATANSMSYGIYCRSGEGITVSDISKSTPGDSVGSSGGNYKNATRTSNVSQRMTAGTTYIFYVGTWSTATGRMRTTLSNIQYACDLVQNYDVTVNYLYDGSPIASQVVTNVESGTSYTPTYENKIYDDDYTYTYSSGAGTQTITANTTIDIIYTRAARATITGTVIAQNGSGVEIGRYTNTAVEPATSVDVASNKYIYSDSTQKWYVADVDTFQRTYTADGSSDVVTYSEAADVVFFQEAEDAANTNKADNWSSYGSQYSGGRTVTTNKTGATMTFDSFTPDVSGTYTVELPHNTDNNSSHYATVRLNGEDIGSYYNGTLFSEEVHLTAGTPYTVSVYTNYSTMANTDYLLVSLVEEDQADPVFTSATDIAQAEDTWLATFRFLTKIDYDGAVDGYGFRIVTFVDADANLGTVIEAPGSYTEETVSPATKDIEYGSSYPFESGKTYYYDIQDIPTYGNAVPSAIGVYAVPYVIKSADAEKGTSAMKVWGTPFTSHTDSLFNSAE